MPPEEIDAAVTEHYGIDVQQLRVHGRSAGEAKVVAVELACRLAGLTGRAIGAHYGKITGSGQHDAPQGSAREVHDRFVVDSLLSQLTAKRRRK